MTFGVRTGSRVLREGVVPLVFFLTATVAMTWPRPSARAAGWPFATRSRLTERPYPDTTCPP